MKNYFYFVLLAFVTPSAFAEIDRPWEVGGALYSTIVDNNLAAFDEDKFSGFALQGTYIINRNVSFRGFFASQSHDDVSIRSRITEVSALFGGGFGREGWKGFVGPTIFRDSWSGSGISQTFSGLGMQFGFGYNWESLALDLTWTIRDSSDYDDFYSDTFGSSIDTDVISFALGLSARF
ncbi:MAG: hypothetical protein C0462_11120 [Alcanivorax sp.]|nr:hypothetical protein [Alcanivorax sp.]